MKRLYIFSKELLRRSTRYRNVVHIVQQALDKSGAINAFFIVAAVFIRGVHPLIDKTVQGNVFQTVGRCFHKSGEPEQHFLFGAEIIRFVSRSRGLYNDRFVFVSRAFARAAAAAQYNNKNQDTK